MQYNCFLAQCTEVQDTNWISKDYSFQNARHQITLLRIYIKSNWSFLMKDTGSMFSDLAAIDISKHTCMSCAYKAGVCRGTPLEPV